MSPTRAVVAAVLAVLALAPSAQAATDLSFAFSSGSRGVGGTSAKLVITGDGASSNVTIQRVETDSPGVPLLANTDMIKVTDPSGTSHDASIGGSDSTDYCKDIPSENSTVCYIADDAAEVRTDGSTLGGGNDTLTVVPATTGKEIDLEMDGGPGNDTLTGGAGHDTLKGGEGSDLLQGNGGRDFFSDAGTTPGDVDTVSYNDTAHNARGVNVTIDDGQSNDGADGIDGATAADTVSAGIDKVVGTDFDDLIFGSAIGDTIVGGLGVDTLYGAAGDDRIEARDSTADSAIDCGDGTDTAITDANDPGVTHCETEDRSAGAAPTTTTTPPLPGLTKAQTGSTTKMPDLGEAPYRGLSFSAMEYELRASVWSVILPAALTYQQAAARSGKAKPRPYDVIAQSPNPGATVTGSALSPVVVRAFYWDPSKDAVKQPCTPSARLRSGDATPRPLTSVLRGLEFREGTAGNEGAAQNLLRRIGCPYDAKFTYSAKVKTATVKVAKAKTLVRRTKTRTTRVQGFVLQVTAPKQGNDFLTTFTEPLALRANELPLSSSLQLPAGRTVRAELNVRETSTGRIAEGAVVELSAPGGAIVASGKAGTDGMVSLTGFIAAAGSYDLYISRARKDPATGDTVTQEGILELTAVTPGATWTGVAGGTYKRKGDGFAKAAAAASLRQAGGGTPGALFAIRLGIDIGKAANVKALAAELARRAGLSDGERQALELKLAAMSGIADDSPARALFGLRQVKLLPGIAATQAGRLCPTWKAPEVKRVDALAYAGGAAISGKTDGAQFGCGRAVLIDPQTGLTLAGPNAVLGGRLIANDGTSLISDHGAGIVSNHSGALVSDNGGGIVSNHTTGLIANDGAALVPVTQLLANDGAGIISNDGGGLQPVGGGTTFLPAGR